VNIGITGLGLLLIAIVTIVGWGAARPLGWSPVLTPVVLLGLVALVGGLQIWRAASRQRRLMREGRWPPDRPQGAA
jgi:hypothetical protein